jgi:chromosome segregation ATPase
MDCQDKSECNCADCNFKRQILKCEVIKLNEYIDEVKYLKKKVTELSSKLDKYSNLSTQSELLNSISARLLILEEDSKKINKEDKQKTTNLVSNLTDQVLKKLNLPSNLNDKMSELDGMSKKIDAIFKKVDYLKGIEKKSDDIKEELDLIKQNFDFNKLMEMNKNYLEITKKINKLNLDELEKNMTSNSEKLIVLTEKIDKFNITKINKDLRFNEEKIVELAKDLNKNKQSITNLYSKIELLDQVKENLTFNYTEFENKIKEFDLALSKFKQDQEEYTRKLNFTKIKCEFLFDQDTLKSKDFDCIKSRIEEINKNLEHINEEKAVVLSKLNLLNFNL